MFLVKKSAARVICIHYLFIYSNHYLRQDILGTTFYLTVVRQKAGPLEWELEKWFENFKLKTNKLHLVNLEIIYTP